MQLRSIRSIVAAAAFGAASLFSAGAFAAGPYTGLFVFGDSLSDSGNNTTIIGANGGQVISGNTYVPAQPYALGAYTNANVWVNSFAAGIGLPAGAVPSRLGGGDYAYGGARTTVNGDFGPLTGFFPLPSAATQLNSYLATNPSGASTALYVIAIGGNDVRSTGDAVAANPVNANAIIGAAAAAYATGVGTMVDALQAKGATNIVVWDAPNVGKSPAAIAGGPIAVATFTAISNAFNAALGARLTGEAGVVPFDIFGLVNTIATNPGAYGLTNIADACGAIAGCNPSQYLFWDGIHPTSAGHAIISNAMLAVVAVPEPASAWMLALGLVGVVLVRRARAA